MDKKIIGYMSAFGEQKTKCSLCGRTHKNTFIVRTDNKNYYYGSGCIQKIGLNNIELNQAINKATHNLSYLNYTITKNILKKLDVVK
jgi:hypothetical protein